MTALFGLRLFLFPAIFVSFGFLGLAKFAYHEKTLEDHYQSQYGNQWMQTYQDQLGLTPQEYRMKLVVGGVAMVAALIICIFVYKQFAPEGKIKPRRRRR